MHGKFPSFWQRHPNLSAITGSLLTGIIITSIYNYEIILIGELLTLIAASALFGLFLIYPAVLTFQNLWQLCRQRYQTELVKTARITDAITILWGAVCVCCYSLISEIRMADWSGTLYNSELHTPIATWTFPTICTIGAVAFIGYLILRFFPLRKLPPLLCVLAMAAMYLGAGLSALFCIQLSRPEILMKIRPSSLIMIDWLDSELPLVLYPFNLLLVFGKTVRHVCTQHEQSGRWPWLAFLLMWPLLGILTAVLILFGQKPDSLIQAFTQTSDWTLSLQKAPPNVLRDEHYLCTVAAGGHPMVVKPLRMGERHGHRIVVNRQLLVANAFEELLAERLPGVHGRLRHFYDTYGYPIARHIRSRWTADLVYLLMKPWEYFFVIILYLFDTKPENRIAVQYLGGKFAHPPVS